MIALLAFIATIPAANWMIGHVGTCIPDGPCVIPVGFGLMAPSGVLMIGLSLALRDTVHGKLGSGWSVVAIFIGSALAAFLAAPALVLASGVAFLISELADLVVYAPLYRRRLVLAVVASGVVGAIVDSAVFLFLAFGSLQFLEGQVVGKAWATIAAALVLMAVRGRREVAA